MLDNGSDRRSEGGRISGELFSTEEVLNVEVFWREMTKREKRLRRAFKNGFDGRRGREYLYSLDGYRSRSRQGLPWLWKKGSQFLDLEFRILDDTVGQRDSGCKAAVLGRDRIFLGTLMSNSEDQRVYAQPRVVISLDGKV